LIHLYKTLVNMPVQRGLAQECQQHFQTLNIYEIFSLTKSASDVQIKKAYRQLALRYHPDRTDIDQKEEAKTKFQIIGKVYAILSDDEKRKIYDDTGALDDDDLAMGVNDWYDYCKKMFRKVTKNDLIEFENKYKGSDEEKNDLKRIYLEVGGDMDQIFERHLLACLEDEDRLRSMIDQMIEDKEVPPFDAYTNESKAKRTKRHKKLTKEAVEAEKLMKELNIGNDEASLERAIQMRHNNAPVRVSTIIFSKNTVRKRTLKNVLPIRSTIINRKKHRLIVPVNELLKPMMKMMMMMMMMMKKMVIQVKH